MNKQTKGFSIIEVVLVLAIAGLIFLMVFIAFPALQRGQHDGARKNDMSVVTSAVGTFRSNNRGSFGTPGGTGAGNLNSTSLRAYIDRLDQYDKDTAVTVLSGTGSATVTATKDTIQVKVGAKCPDSMPAPGTMAVSLDASSTRTAAVVSALENNGATEVAYCQNA